MSSWECPGMNIVAEVVFFLFKIGESMLDPTVRLFIYQGVCFQHYENNTCAHLRFHPEEQQDVQHKAANYIMYYKILLNFPAVFLGLFCGAWSDKIGRKLPVMLTSFGTILAVICYMLSMFVQDMGPFLPLVLIGAAIRGGFGKSAVMTMALHSYISDISTTEERTKRIGRLLAMNFFGYFVGSLAAGSLLYVSSYDVIFCAVVFVNSLCVLVTVLFMRDSISRDTDVSQDESEKRITHKTPFHFSNVRESLDVITRLRPGRGRCHILMLFCAIIVHQLCKSGETDVTLLFVQHNPLDWGKSMYGYLLALDYACLGIAVFVILPVLIRLFNPNDMTLILIGIAFKIVRLVIMSVSSHTWMVYLAVVVGCPSAMVISGVKSLISKSVAENEMGKIFSLLSCGETISNLLGSIIFTSVYVAALSLYPGFTFSVDSAAFAILFVGMIFLARDMKNDDENEPISSYQRHEDSYGSACATDMSSVSREESAETVIIGKEQKNTTHDP